MTAKISKFPKKDRFNFVFFIFLLLIVIISEKSCNFVANW